MKTSGAKYGSCGVLPGVLMLCVACTGPKGDPGADGKNGANGSDGTDGINGANGANGTHRLPGPQGDAGPAGQDGRDGDAGANAIDKASVTAESQFTPLVAGVTTQFDPGVDRTTGAVLNIDRYHTAGKPTFRNANCTACHGVRAGQLSGVATLKTFHGIAAHGAGGCVLCHSSTIDLVNASNVVIRKTVSATVCKVCHSLYPARFCTATTGLPACP